MENISKQEIFDIERSSIKEAYLLLNAHTPFELSDLYNAEDQKLMMSQAWDYENPELITNKVKAILELVNAASLTPEEQKWKQEILWFWYHHAISCAIWRYKDKEAARTYADKALEYQSEDHPNKITQLLSLLIDGQLEAAENWLNGIKEEPEKSTAAELVADYKKQSFF